MNARRYLKRCWREKARGRCCLGSYRCVGSQNAPCMLPHAIVYTFSEYNFRVYRVFDRTFTKIRMYCVFYHMCSRLDIDAMCSRLDSQNIIFRICRIFYHMCATWLLNVLCILPHVFASRFSEYSVYSTTCVPHGCQNAFYHT